MPMNDTLKVILDTDDPPRSEEERRLWMTRRQAIIMELGAIEDYLDLPRSIVPKRKRDQELNERRAS